MGFLRGTNDEENWRLLGERSVWAWKWREMVARRPFECGARLLHMDEVWRSADLSKVWDIWSFRIGD
jgi:hypothetical protein